MLVHSSPHAHTHTHAQYQQPAGYPQPGTYQAAAPVVTGPQLPTGYKVLDAFQSGNIVQLISRSSGNPLTVVQNAFCCKGLLGNNECKYINDTYHMKGLIVSYRKMFKLLKLDLPN